MHYDDVDYSRYYMKNTHTYTEEVDDEPHEIEYISRGKKKGNREDRSGHTSHHKLRNLGIVTCCILMVIVVSLLVYDSVNGGTWLSGLSEVLGSHQGDKKTYYAVEVATYDDMESARLYAHQKRKAGGGGYVIFDEGYRVLVEVYADKGDAEDIAKGLRLEGENARVYDMTIENIDYSRFPESTRASVRGSIAFLDRIYTSLYAIGIDLAKSNIDENSAKMRIKGIYDETHNVLVEFTSIVDRYDSDLDIIKVKATLTSICSMLTNLTKDVVQRPSLISDIRYTSCLIVNSYRELSHDLAK